MPAISIIPTISARLMALGCVAVLSLWFTAPPAHALTPLNEEEHINHSLISAGIADQIRKNCTSVYARMFRVLRKAKELEQYARDLGYSEPDVVAFLKSPVERKRVQAAIDAYLAENGVVHGTEATYCSLGRAEIASGSLVGQLLWRW